ncbi:transposase, IS4 family [Micromonospora haikouensis]|uniref:Transposase, IS4 family n=5 Tax=Micromonospora haikouensis TaxID=686309 RepID=A0A1C4YTW1_9ACTN|nr:transposase, IS4 family [Micromonospora haikouensis]
MVDAVLAQTCCLQRRVRDLPSRVVVYLLLAGCLFAEFGYRQVWQRLVAGLEGVPVAEPSEAALTKARRRLGPQPLRALFDLLRGPAASMAGPVRWRGLLVCAIDGTTLFVADSAANLARYSKQRGGRTGGSSHPMLRLVTIMACGTRSVMDAAFGPITCGETTYAKDMLARLPAGVLLLADRNFAAGQLLNLVTGRDAHLLVRAKTGRGGPRLPVLLRLPDGSYLSVFGGQRVRVIDAEISITTNAATVTGIYRLITTLLAPDAYPATAILRLYHERWEIETAYLEIKSGILGGRVLRARTPAGVDQEIHALLITYQILRTAMTDATNSEPGTDPDRASFTIALHAARDQVIHAAGVIAGTVTDLIGRIGRLVLDQLLPERRLRVNARTVKRAISKYNARGPNIDRRTYQATISLNILAGPVLTTSPEP